MTRVWKRILESLHGRHSRRCSQPARQAADIESLEERAVLSASTLAVGSDTYLINYPAPDGNVGGADVVRLFKGGAAVDRPLMQVDLSSLNAGGSSITSAVLELYRSGSSYDNQAMNVSIYAVSRPWAEGTQTYEGAPSDGATWNQALPGVNWGTPGGDFSNVDFGHGANGLIQVATVPAFVSAGWLQFDITTAVKAWKDGQVANNGLAFVINSGDYTEHRFASSEASDTSLRPRLVVNVADDATTSHRSPVATFILSQVHSTDAQSPWSQRGGQVISAIAQSLRSIDNDHGHSAQSGGLGSSGNAASPATGKSANAHAANPTTLDRGLGGLPGVFA